jgi:hypothetical protein
LNLATVSSGRELIKQAATLGIERSSVEFDVWLSRNENKELFDRAMAEGAALAERRASKRPLPIWYQLVPNCRPVSLAPATIFGLNPLDHDEEGRYRCSFGHTRGWTTLSEPFVVRSTWDGSDFCVTSQLVGKHEIPGSLFYPHPLFLVSQKMKSVLDQNRVEGVTVEVAHFIDS